MDLTNMTDDQLVAKQQELGAQIDALRAERLQYADEMRRRQSNVGQATAALASLSPEALEELKKQLGVVATAQPLPPVEPPVAPQ